MKPNSIKVAMVQSAAKKGIRDIKDEPKRGIRNLVEMGEMFATGRFQQDFFEMAMGQLHDESSAYYRIVERVAKTVDEDTLLTFGTNLGYNALTHGAGVIRSIEQKQGFNVPWCLNIELSARHTTPHLDVERIIREGKELGVYCYLFYIDAGYPQLEKLYHTLHAQKDCAFLLFLNSAMVTDAFCQSLLELHNVIPVLDMDGANDDVLTTVIDELSHVGALFAGFTRFGDASQPDISPNMLQRAETLDLPVLVLLRIKKHRPQNEDDVYRQVVTLRKNLDVPVLPIDLYGDIAHADRIISSEACLATIKGDGSVLLTNVDEQETVSSYSVHTDSLQQILKRAMPKHIDP